MGQTRSRLDDDLIESNQMYFFFSFLLPHYEQNNVQAAA